MAIDLSGLPDQSEPVSQPTSGIDLSGLPDQGNTGTATVGPLEDVQMGQAPQTPADYGAQIGGEPQLSPEQLAGVQQNLENAGGAALDMAKGVPSMLAQIPKYGYEGVKVQTGNESLLDAARSIMHDAVPQGQAMAAGINSPVGSREWDSAALQMAMMGLPALEFLPKGLKVAGELEKPPVQAPEGTVEAPSGPASASEAPVAPETAPPVQEAVKPSSVEPQTATATKSTIEDLRRAVSEGRFDDARDISKAMEADLRPQPQDATIQKPVTEAPKIVSAAIRIDKTGKVYTGASHPSIINDNPALADDFFTNGFVDQNGRFYDKDDATRLTRRLGITAEDLQQGPIATTIPSQDEFAGKLPTEASKAENISGQQPEAADTGQPGMVRPADTGVGGERGYNTEQRPAGTSNRQNTETYGADVVPGGEGADTLQLLDNARADIRSGAVDPYSVLSKTRADGIASPKEYAALAAEHERLVNEAVAKEKAGDPTAPEAAKQASDFANAIQPHKTAASDLMRLFQGDLNYDLSTDFGMEQYMKAEIGRGMKPNEVPKFRQHVQRIRQAEVGSQEAVGRSDIKVQRHYAKVRDIPMEEAAARVKEWLKDCVV
jgi:hypothetical protein